MTIRLGRYMSANLVLKGMWQTTLERTHGVIKEWQVSSLFDILGTWKEKICVTRGSSWLVTCHQVMQELRHSRIFSSGVLTPVLTQRPKVPNVEDPKWIPFVRSEYHFRCILDRWLCSRIRVNGSWTPGKNYLGKHEGERFQIAKGQSPGVKDSHWIKEDTQQ